MKKLFTLLLLTLAAFTFKTSAQSTPCNAAFDFSISGLTVKFKAAVTADSSGYHYYWKFGDGKVSSEFSPGHTYTTPGIYTVKHFVYRSNNTGTALCVDSVEKKIEIRTATISCNLQAKFTFERDPSQTNKVKFTNLSGPNIKEVKWSFGDGTYSTDLNPSHVYKNSGLYKVCLIVKGDNCVSDTCGNVQVQVSSVPPSCNMEAYFSWSADSLHMNKILFKNVSSHFEHGDSIRWSFGDGTFSTDVNPAHIYNAPGTYNVCIRIKKHTSAGTICVKEYCKQIIVKERDEINCLDISKFTITKSTLNCLEFKFIPSVQNPNWKYVWSFGDGTGSTHMNPSHVYHRSGRYITHLTIYKATNCVSTSSKVIETGNCTPCNDIWVKFKYQRESSFSNRVYFYSLSNYPVASQKWTITKLTVAGALPVIINQNNPVYIFNEPGDYRVCLRAVTKEGCVKEYCEVIRIGSSNTNCVLQVYPNPAHNQVGLNVYLLQPSVIHVYIYNSMNILVKHKDQSGYTGNNVVTTNIEGLVPGWYTVKIIYGNKVCYARFQKI